jgi:hypothetical protein
MYLHRQILTVKKIPDALKSALDEDGRIVNFTKTKPLISRIFSALREERGSSYTKLLLHAEVGWLSRGRVLVRVLTLRSEILLSSVDLPAFITSV